MKRLLAIVLSLTLILTGCAPASSNQTSVDQSEITKVTQENTEKGPLKTMPVETTLSTGALDTANTTEKDFEDQKSVVHFSGLDDAELLTYVENTVYDELIDEINSEEYFVEKVEAIYLSQEYLEEFAYNSQSNVFFGYTLEELEEEFSGKRYVFTLGDDCHTTVVELEEIYDDTYDQVINNVTIGGGVILVCVTVSVVTAGGAPAVSMIFAASASTGTTFALQSGAISFATAAIARGYQTQDFDQAIKAGTFAASEGFKWGAIIGAATGGIKEGIALKGAELNGLTMNEAAVIQRESKWPLEGIKALHSKEEYKIYKDASLIPTQLTDESWAFLRKIDWKMVDGSGKTNVERVVAGLAPIDSTGMPYELHHIGMKADSPLAILTYAEHHSKENYKILHWAEEGKNVTSEAWKAQKKEFWNAILKMAQEVS